MFIAIYTLSDTKHKKPLQYWLYLSAGYYYFTIKIVESHWEGGKPAAVENKYSWVYSWQQPKMTGARILVIAALGRGGQTSR